MNSQPDPVCTREPILRAAFQQVWKSLADFTDLSGNALSGKGMKGFTKHSRNLIKSNDIVGTKRNIETFKSAFVKGGGFKGADFEGVMKKIGDEALFEFDGATGTFASKKTGVKYSRHPDGSYGQGEEDALTHILRGHTDNDWRSAEAAAGNLKSYFTDPSKIPDLVDQALQMPVSSRVPSGPNGFWVDLGPNTIVGKNRAVVPSDTTRIAIGFQPGTTNVIATAYPY